MAATQVKGSLQGPAGFLSARKPWRSIGFSSHVVVGRVCIIHPRQQRVIFPSVACSADHNSWRRTSKDQEPNRFMRGGKKFRDGAGGFAPTTYLDSLNRLRRRSPLSDELARMYIEEGDEQHAKDRQQSGRNFVDGIVSCVSSDKERFEFIINACKENTNMINEMGFISSYGRDEIMKCLEKIEDEILNGRFEWIEDKDVQSNIVEALIERVGEPARKLDTALSRRVQKLAILRMWFYDSVDKMVTQIKLLQVELVLLALRNWGFVLPHLLLARLLNWILLGDLILSKVELLEEDASQLRTCRENIDFMLLATFQLGSAGGANRLLEDGRIHNAVISFANMIAGDVATNLCSLEEELRLWYGLQFLAPNDKVTEIVSLLREYITDLDEVADIRSDSLTNNSTQDVSQRFLKFYTIVEQTLKVIADFCKNASFNHENVQGCLTNGSAKTSGYKILRMINKVKENNNDGSDKKEGDDEYSKMMQDFKSRSDVTMKKLLDWLVKHQTGGNLNSL